MPTPKYNTIYNWKKSGLIYDDYDELYETYIKTMQCGHCQTEFTKNNCRCLDHDHTTGLFRKIVCNRCNVWDSYIKNPRGHANKEYKKEKIKCECGSIVGRSVIARHNRSIKHIEYLNNI